MVSIDADLNEIKIAADYESVTIGKSDFYEFSFTKLDNLSWTESFPDLTEKVLFQIRMINKTSSRVIPIKYNRFTTLIKNRSSRVWIYRKRK